MEDRVKRIEKALDHFLPERKGSLSETVTDAMRYSLLNGGKRVRAVLTLAFCELCDTAGIRDTADAVEKIGVDRARAAARQASLALLVLDGSRPLTEADREAMALARQVPNLLVAVNKADLPRAVDIGRLADDFDNVVSLSARSGQGVDVLCDAIQALYPAGEGRPGELLTNARQADAVSRALAAVRSARGALRTGMTPDVVLTDAETALEALGELNGKHIRDDLIQTIFSRFCVGK